MAEKRFLKRYAADLPRQQFPIAVFQGALALFIQADSHDQQTSLRSALVDVSDVDGFSDPLENDLVRTMFSDNEFVCVAGTVFELAFY